MTSAKALNAKNKRKIEDFKTKSLGYSPTKCFVVYWEDMMRLLAFPKSAHAQLCLMLPVTMGFRAKEVCTWRAEYIDFDRGNTLVMDAKKKQLFMVPLNFQVAALVEKLLKGRTEGYVLRSRSNAQQDPNKPLNPASVWHTWRKWSMKARLFNWEDFSPIVGRRFFAAEWYHHQGLSLLLLSMIMRHSDTRITLAYVEKLIFYEDLKREYKRFQFNFLQKKEPSMLRMEKLKEMMEDVFNEFKAWERNLKSEKQVVKVRA